MARVTKAPRWAWCPTCREWVGAIPPMLPPFWSLDKAAGLHIHKVERVTLAQVLSWR